VAIARLLRNAAPVLLAGSLVLGAAGPGLAAPAPDLPDLGEESLSVLPLAEERKLGAQFIRQARAQLNFLYDPELADYLQGVGNDLVAKSGNHAYQFQFFWISDPSLNAFAVPGGFIGVHTGLIEATRNESEFASVLAHEITHVTQRHIPRMLAESQHRTLPTMAAILAGVLLGGQAGQAAIAATSAYNIQEQLRFTRSFEREADRLGMDILARSRFDPGAMPAFFERLLQYSRGYESGMPDFLLTHPVTTDRIAESWSRAEQYPGRAAPDASAFDHARAKIRVITARDATQVEEQMREEATVTAASPAARYGYILALTANRKYDQARERAAALLRDYPGRPAYLVAQAQVESGAGNTDRALALLEAARRAHPASFPIAFYYADALLKARRPGPAYAVARIVAKERPDDPAVRRLLARAAGDAGDEVEAHRALAEHYYLMGNARAAVIQLQQAQNLARGNFYIQSSVEARRREIEQEFDIKKSDENKRDRKN